MKIIENKYDIKSKYKIFFIVFKNRNPKYIDIYKQKIINVTNIIKNDKWKFSTYNYPCISKNDIYIYIYI